MRECSTDPVLIFGFLVAAVVLVTSTTLGAELFVPQAKIDALVNGVGVAEGFGVPGAIPTLAHNPGDLELGDIGNGLLGEGITVYASDADGAAALAHIVRGWLAGTSKIYFLTDSIREVGRKYVEGPNAPETANSLAWAGNVATVLGVDIETTLGTWLKQ